MTQPITNTTPVKANAYIQVEGGVNNYTNARGLNLGATLGGEINKAGTYANAEVGYGTAFKEKAEVGHEFNIGKNMGLDLSANAEYKKSTVSNTYTTSLRTDNAMVRDSNKWHYGLKKVGTALMMSFHGKKGNIKIGAEVGVYANSAPNITKNYTINVDKKLTVNNIETIIREIYNAEFCHNGSNSGMYVTPKISAELNLGKKGHWSAVANADAFGGNAGIRYTF